MILTPHEVNILTGRAVGTSDHKWKAVKKLVAFQNSITDPAYIAAVNALIPQAEQTARTMSKGWAGWKAGVSWDKVFHSEMTRLKRLI